MENTIWWNDESSKKLAESLRNINFMFFGSEEPIQEITEEQKIERRLKYALLKSGNIIYIDNETMIGYKSVDDNFQKGWKKPLEVLKYREFDRWARGFDL